MRPLQMALRTHAELAARNNYYWMCLSNANDSMGTLLRQLNRRRNIKYVVCWPHRGPDPFWPGILELSKSIAAGC